MPIPLHHTRCIGKRMLVPGVFEIRLEKPAGFKFVPGQFVMFDVPSPDDPSDIQVRAYSIASAPGEKDLLFVIKLVPGGRASRWVEEQLSEGTEVSMKGPLGAFTLDSATDLPYCFIATGTGVAPFRSQIVSSLKEQGDKRGMDLIFGIRAKEDLFWEAEWRKLEEEYPNFRMHVSFLDGTANWHGESGVLRDMAPAVLGDLTDVSIYLCGSPDLLKSLKECCLGPWKIPKEHVHVESYV